MKKQKKTRSCSTSIPETGINCVEVIVHCPSLRVSVYVDWKRNLYAIAALKKVGTSSSKSHLNESLEVEQEHLQEWIAAQEKDPGLRDLSPQAKSSLYKAFLEVIAEGKISI